MRPTDRPTREGDDRAKRTTKETLRRGRKARATRRKLERERIRRGDRPSFNHFGA